MTEGRSPLAKPMAWWGVIAGAVRERATTAEIWGAIRDYGQEHGVDYPPSIFQDVNRMRSQAASLRNTSANLAEADPDDALTAAHLAPLPYARTGVEQSLARQFHVRVEYTALRAGAEERSYITLPYSGTLPDTVGDLYSDAELAASDLVEGYGASILSVDRIEIGEW